MNVIVRGTGKAKDIPPTYETELELESAQNLVKKGYVVIIDSFSAKEEPVKSEPKTMTTQNSQVSGGGETKEVIDEKANLIAAKEKEYNEAPDKETKRKLKKELDALKKK